MTNLQHISLFLGVFLAGAALWDLRFKRVPNCWILAWYILGFLLFFSQGFFEAGRYFLHSLVPVVCFSLFFLAHMMGAADIKVMGVICGYLGLFPAALVIGIGFFLAACFALAKLFFCSLLNERFRFLFAYFRRTIQTKQITAYYVKQRDKEAVILPLVFFLWLGFLVFVVLHLHAMGGGG